MDLADRARREARPARADRAAGRRAVPAEGPRAPARRHARPPTPAGSIVDDVAETDSPLTSLYKAAGLAIFGKTNTPELGLEPVTEPVDVRPDPQSLGPQPHLRRLLRRRGRGGGGGDRAGGARQRRRRLDPHPGLVLRPVRAEAVARPRLGRAEGRRAGAAFPAATWSPTRCATAPSCSTSPAARSRAIPTGPRRRPSRSSPARERDPAPLRIAFTTAAFSAPGLEPECAEAVREAARLCERPRPPRRGGRPADRPRRAGRRRRGDRRQRRGRSRHRRLEARPPDRRGRGRADHLDQLPAWAQHRRLCLHPGAARRPRPRPRGRRASSSATTS